jgi:hypothetical protein
MWNQPERAFESAARKRNQTGPFVPLKTKHRLFMGGAMFVHADAGQ